MTETDWLFCTDSTVMLELIRWGTSARKLRLYAVACVRRIGEPLTDARSRTAVDVAERFADGQATAEELAKAYAAASAATRLGGHHASAAVVAQSVAHPVAHVAAFIASDVGARISEGVARARCDLLRDLVGDRPFRSPPTVCPAPEQNECVVRLAQRIYDDRDFADLPALADALAAAGCTNADLLSHCRSQAEHALGCWALDAILRKAS